MNNFYSRIFTILLFLFLISTFISGQAPSNDECISPQILLPGPTTDCTGYTYTGSTANATMSPPLIAGCPDESAFDDDVWFQITLNPVVNKFLIQTTNTGTTNDFAYGFYDGDCNFLVPIICGDQFTDDHSFRFCPPANSTFYIRVATAAVGTSDVFEFEICVTEQCYPSVVLNGPNPGIKVTDDIEVIGLISSTELIQTNTIVDYDSELQIDLDPGFEVQTGAVFEAFIDGCDYRGGGSNN